MMLHRLAVPFLALSLIVGGTLALSDTAAAQDRYRYEDRRGQDYRYDARSRYGDPVADLNRAAELCVERVERGRDRVEVLDEARRSRDGWQVSGQIEGGRSWTCEVDRNGRVRDVDFDADRYSYRSDNRQDGDYRYDQRPTDNDRYDRNDPYASREGRAGQWSAEDYARARARTRTPADRGYEYRDDGYGTSPQTSYPGGPVSDDNYDVDGDIDDSGTWEGDGRYDTGNTPDFRQPGR